MVEVKNTEYCMKLIQRLDKLSPLEASYLMDCIELLKGNKEKR
ncbi:hypothetical protein [Saccharolobus sp. A20]|nr:hypothetical protein [Sulfolobus sp. A20]